MKKADIVFAMVIIVAALSFLGAMYVNRNQLAERVEIVADGRLYGEYSLIENQEFDVLDQQGGFNHIVISDGKVMVTDANCPDLLCVKQKSISKKGEAIICLPHKLSVTITEGSEGTIDSIAK